MNRVLPPLPEPDVIVSPPEPDAGFGALDTARGPLPLKALDVHATIDGLVACTDLAQTFVNTHAEPLEATYIFPLPDRAAVTRFRLAVAGRVVEGVLKERGAARREYDQAIKDGHRAAITEEERPGVFTIRVGNLPPGETATVRLSLTGPLPYADGEATYRFPLVVAPRYIPGVPLPGPSVGDGTAADTDAVPDASRITPPVLLPGFPNPVRLSLAVGVRPSALAAADFRSSLHAVAEESEGLVRKIVLHPGERLDRDFILRFRLGNERIGTSLVVQPDETGDEGTFLLTLAPPAARKDGLGRPRDVAFVLDRSGSMGGWKMVAARRAMARMVDALTDRDRFAVLAFDNSIETPPGFEGWSLAPATDHRRFQAAEFLGRVEARGGTEMAQPLDAATAELLRDESDRGRDRILVLVTDGQVGNEDQLLRKLAPRLKQMRVFTLGVDRAVNAAFLKRLSDLGGGTSELVESEERLDDVMDRVHRHIGTPLLTGLRLEPAGLRFLPESIVPARLPDLFAGAPLTILGRYRGAATGGVALQARDASGSTWSTKVEARREPSPVAGVVWARGRLRDLEDRYVIGAGDRSRREREITELSLRFGVLCRFTAFVAVDRTEVVNAGGQVHSIVQPVEQPAGWEMPAAGTYGLYRLRAAAAPQALGGMAMPASPPRDTASVDSFSAMEAPPTPRQPAKARRRNFQRGSADMLKSVAPTAKGLGLLQQLLALFGGKKGKPPAVNRDRFRQRLADALQAIRQHPTPDAGSRVDVLRALTPALETVFTEWTTAGERDESVRELGELVMALHGLLAQAKPADADVQALWARTEAVVQQCLTLCGGPPAGERREGFWK
jgi:Ca-activated chloride channel family protein